MSRFDDNPLEELGRRVIPILSAITIDRFTLGSTSPTLSGIPRNGQHLIAFDG